MTNGHTAISPIILGIPQSITADWVDVGEQYSSFGFNVIGIYLNLTINDSQDFRIRLLAKKSPEDTDEYVLPIYLRTSVKTHINDFFAEIDVDENKKILLLFEIDSVIPYFKIQVQGGFVGSTPATIDSIAYVLGVK